MVRSPDRRPKRDQPGASTRERLLAATVASCVEHGYRGATLADIASRAGVSAPAIYNHFGDRAELLVEAGRWALDRLEPRPPGATPSAATAVHVFLGDGFAETRRFLVELHLAAQRDRDVADLLAKWHGDQASLWVEQSPGRDGEAAVKTFFVVLLGLCQFDALSSLRGSSEDVEARIVPMLRVLFPEEEIR